MILKIMMIGRFPEKYPATDQLPEHPGSRNLPRYILARLRSDSQRGMSTSLPAPELWPAPVIVWGMAGIDWRAASSALSHVFFEIYSSGARIAPDFPLGGIFCVSFAFLQVLVFTGKAKRLPVAE
jgi:hypothetical protein